MTFPNTGPPHGRLITPKARPPERLTYIAWCAPTAPYGPFETLSVWAVWQLLTRRSRARTPFTGRRRLTLKPDAFRVRLIRMVGFG